MGLCSVIHIESSEPIAELKASSEESQQAASGFISRVLRLMSPAFSGLKVQPCKQGNSHRSGMYCTYIYSNY